MNQTVTQLPFTPQKLEKIRAAEVAYRRLFEIRATSPDWQQAHGEWKKLAEELAVDLIRNLGAQEGYWL